MKFSEMPYTRVDLEETKKAFEELTNRVKGAASGEELYLVHKDYYKLSDEVRTEIELATIRYSIDTTDEFYVKENEYNDNLRPVLEDCINTYNRALYDSPYRSYMEEKIGKVAFKNMEIGFKAFDSKLVPLMQEENALISRYDKLIASAKIPFEGEIYNLSLMRKFQTSQDREVRKNAWTAVSEYFQTVADELDEIYDLLVKNRTAQAKMMGYESFTELGYYRMGRNCYDQAMVENFRRQIKESFVPFVTKIHERRRERLGLDKLKYYDVGMYFTNGNPAPLGTPEEILKAGQEMYRELSPETAEFFDFMMENELFDVLGRKTKQQGGYMTFIPKYKSPFIFANFNGTEGDINVITHECGHAFQGYLMRNAEIPEHCDIGMETAETHSMSMEYFTEAWMEKFFGDRADDYRMMHLEDACVFIPYGCMVDEFQHIVYNNPELTPAQRNQEWKKLEEAYRPLLDFDGDPYYGKGAFWQKQLHIYVCPFYYIDYVIASINAMQFKVRMDEDYQSAWADYLKFCKLSASDFFTNMVKEVGLRSPFEDGCIEELVEKL